MDIDLEARLNNIMCSDEDTESCPACGTLHPIILIKHFMSNDQVLKLSDGTRIKKNAFFGSGLFKTMVCFACNSEWIPKITE